MQSLEKEIETIKARLLTLGDLRPGSFSEQYTVCGKPGCRCSADPPQKHGPYGQLSYTRHSKSYTQFVRRDDVRAVTAQIRTYAQLRRLVDRWVTLSTQLCQLRLNAQRNG